jgi:hypothetical protein
MRRSLWFVCLLAAVACGRVPLDLAATGSGGGMGSAGATGAAGTDSGGGGYAGMVVGDRGQGRTPLYHRATSSTCPSQRGPGASSIIENGMPGFPPCPTPPPATSVCCSSDSQCGGGTNGRCTTAGGRGGNECSYDNCFTDSQCPSGVPCLCRSSPTDNARNTCAPAGNCRVDSDCGRGGYCSPSPSAEAQECGNVNPYSGPFYCHTASDTCIDSGDCLADAGFVACVYDPQTRHWACSPPTFCPP